MFMHLLSFHHRIKLLGLYLIVVRSFDETLFVLMLVPSSSNIGARWFPQSFGGYRAFSIITHNWALA